MHQAITQTIRIGVLLAMATAVAAADDKKPAPPPAPLDLSQLKAWAPLAAKAPFKLNAVDANVSELLRMTSQNILLLPTTDVATGRLATTSAGDIERLLAAAFPNQRIQKRLSGGGAAVQLDFATAPTADLVNLCAQVMNANIVVATAALPSLSVKAQRVACKSLLTSVAALTGNVFEAVPGGANLFMFRDSTGSTLDRAMLSEKGPWLAIDTDTKLHAGELLALVKAVSGTPYGADCTAGSTFNVRLRFVRPGALAAVAARLGGAVVDKSKACVVPVIKHAPSDATLVGIVQQGSQRAALLRAQSGLGIVTKTDTDNVKEIGPGFVTLQDQTTKKPNPEVAKVLHPVAEPAADIMSMLKDATNKLLTSRVAATYIGKRNAALLERSDGTWAIVLSGKGGTTDAAPLNAVTVFEDRIEFATNEAGELATNGKLHKLFLRGR